MDLFPRRYFDNMFDDFMPTTVDKMKCDIYEKDGKYHIEVDLPGFEKKDISVLVKDGYLTIKAERKSEVDDSDEERNYIRRERVYGSFERSFSLGDLDQNNIDASFNNGTLTVVVPKKEETEQKTFIEIK